MLIGGPRPVEGRGAATTIEGGRGGGVSGGGGLPIPAIVSSTPLPGALLHAAGRGRDRGDLR